MMNFGGKPPIFCFFCQFLDNPPLLKENLPKTGPLFREFGAQNPPIWAAHTRTLNMLCTPSGYVSDQNQVKCTPGLQGRRIFCKIFKELVMQIATALFLQKRRGNQRALAGAHDVAKTPRIRKRSNFFLGISSLSSGKIHVLLDVITKIHDKFLNSLNRSISFGPPSKTSFCGEFPVTSYNEEITMGRSVL